MDPSNAADSVSLGGSSGSMMARSPEACFDGKNRSLPHPRGGPYQCPRCEDLFRSSPGFASHMRSHYKAEREDRNLRRQASRRRPYRANRCLTGTGPDGHGDSTRGNDKAEVETLAGDVPMDVQAENVELGEEEVKNVQGIENAKGNLEI